MATPALAGCSATGNYEITVCDDSAIEVHAKGDQVFVDISDMPTTGPIFLTNDGSQSSVSIGAEINGTSVTAPQDGVTVQTNGGSIGLTIGADSEINAEESGIYAKTVLPAGTGGTVSVVNNGKITAGNSATPVLDNAGIVALSSRGGVEVTNTGSVTSLEGKGISVDAGFATTANIIVKVTNSGTVEGAEAGIAAKASAGMAYIVNEATGMITSTDGVGIRAEASPGTPVGIAIIENAGQITTTDHAVVQVMGTTMATLTNSGTLTLQNADSYASDLYAAEVSTKTGNVTVTNTVDGDISAAARGTGLRAASAKGQVTITNEGRITGKSTGVYLTQQQSGVVDAATLDQFRAVGSGKALEITNSGDIQAGSFGTGILAIVSGAGEVTVSNEAGGYIGAGERPAVGFDGVFELSASELDTLTNGTFGAAVRLIGYADTTSIDNAGVMVGGVQLWQINGVVDTGEVQVKNSGTWLATEDIGSAFSPDDFYIDNTGDMALLGYATVNANLTNSGRLGLVGMGDYAPNFSVSHYHGGENSILALSLGAQFDPDGPIFQIGDVDGHSEVSLRNIDGWQWTDGDTLDVIGVENQVGSYGADSFSMQQTALGLGLFDLAYDADDQIWYLVATANAAAPEELGTRTAVVARRLATLNASALARVESLHDGNTSGTASSAAQGYAASPVAAMDEAMAALQPPPSGISIWTDAGGTIGEADDYALSSGAMSFGVDASLSQGGGRYAFGGFGNIGGQKLDFDDDDAAAIGTFGGGIYGLAMLPSGLYASAIAEAKSASIGLTFNAVDADTAGFAYGGRFDVGYRGEMAGLVIDPSVGMAAGRAQIDSFTLDGADVDVADGEYLATEARLRLGKRFATDTFDLRPYVVLTLGNEWADGGDATVTALNSAVSGDEGLYGGIEAGVSLDSFDGLTSGYAKAELTRGAEASEASLRLGGMRRF